MCPTAFLAPTLTAKTCSICTQPQNAFFLAQLALQGNRAKGKKSSPGRVPGPKKGTKMVPKSGSFQKEFFCSVAKKSPKNWTGPWLSLNMVRRNKFIKWQNLRLKVQPNAAQPNAVATACQNDDRITYCAGPWIWGWQNCTSRSQKLEPHLLVKVHSASAPWLNHCRPQCNIRMAAEIDIAIFEWQTRRRRPKTASETSCVKKAPSPNCRPNILS